MATRIALALGAVFSGALAMEAGGPGGAAERDCGIVKVGVANLRARPEHAAELVDQAIMGDTLELLECQGAWFRVRTAYEYLGWVEGGSLVRTDRAGVEQWNEAAKATVRAYAAIVSSEPNQDSTPVTDVTLNARLRLIELGRDWMRVATPDGRSGFIASQAVATGERRVLDETLPGAIVGTAAGMTGVSYLWGGNSTKANDCSGFVQTVFRANGIALPRDAHQQAEKGEEVSLEGGFGRLRAGDLLFFGSAERITHVGISLGGARFIHQSSYVHENSLDPNHEDYSEHLSGILVKAKRVIGGRAGR